MTDDKKLKAQARRKARKNRQPVDVTESLMAHYPKSYSSWAGNKNGVKPDFSCCCKSVQSRDGWRSHQCSKPNGHGPDGAYCKTHDPEAVEARRKKSTEAYYEGFRRDMIGAMSPVVRAMIAIENGHNDPRGLAKETLDKFRKQDWWKDPGDPSP